MVFPAFALFVNILFAVLVAFILRFLFFVCRNFHLLLNEKKYSDLLYSIKKIFSIEYVRKSKNNKLIFLVLALILLGVVFWRYLNIKDPSVRMESNAPKESISVCTADPEQKECYVDFPKPILNWKCEFGEKKVENYFINIQIDDSSDYSSPELDTGEMQTKDAFYTVAVAGLKFDTAYKWRIRVRNLYGVWSDWADGDKEFITSPMCK
jgi:hypothetical protein